MKNYQKLYYANYYEMTPDGDHIEVSRRACFAPPEDPTAENLFKQRWFYSPDQGIAIRLPRNELGDRTGKDNAADLRKMERDNARKTQCVWNGTKKCDQQCDYCTRKVARTLELDKTYEGEDGLVSRFEPADESADIEKILEDKERLSTLFAALERLSPDDRELWELMKVKAKKQDIADRFGLTLDGVRYREKRLTGILRSDGSLIAFFEKE
jgi:hypothetical protein